MDFQCPFQSGKFCLSEGESDVVLAGFIAYLSYVVDQHCQRAQEGSEEDATDEIEWVGGILAGNNFYNVGHRERQAASWQPDVTCCSGGSGMRNRVLRSNHFTSIGSEVVLAGAQQSPGTFSYTVCR